MLIPLAVNYVNKQFYKYGYTTLLFKFPLLTTHNFNELVNRFLSKNTKLTLK